MQVINNLYVNNYALQRHFIFVWASLSLDVRAGMLSLKINN